MGWTVLLSHDQIQFCYQGMRRKNKNGMLVTRLWIVLMAGVLLLTLASCDASVEPELDHSGVPINLNDDPPDPSTGCIVPTDLFADGGVGKDGIPALTNPPLFTVCCCFLSR